ncbi:PE domain-containing protein [Actinokineospora sp.]|uniref:PE domain-containing protein n=1 Tax=Actinokineospora sp. TaxID=1872133 RepID=UPI00403813BC
MHDAGGMGSIGSAIGAFAGAAASGAVSINPDEAQVALAEIGNVKHEIQDLLASASVDGVEVSLGANPVGEAMARKSMDRFSGQGDSFLAVLDQLFTQTERAEQALRQAIANYQDTDYGNATRYRG